MNILLLDIVRYMLHLYTGGNAEGHERFGIGLVDVNGRQTVVSACQHSQNNPIQVNNAYLFF